MNLKDIEVGEEYAVGRPTWSLERARVLEVGTYNVEVPVSKYSIRTTKKAVKGVRLQYLTRDGELATTNVVQFSQCEVCQGTGEADTPDPDFADVTHKVPCTADGCDSGKVRSYTKVPKVDWEPARKVQTTWKAHTAAQQAKTDNERKREEARREMGAVAKELVTALEAVGIKADDYTRYDSYRCTIGLSIGNARELMHLLSTVNVSEEVG